jgi:tRNA(Ile)-lysidine synthase
MPAADLKIAIPDRFGPCERYLVGVSGGRDSVALLDMLLNHGYKNLVVCHLNHRLRGSAGAADVRFVEKLARARHLQVVTHADDVRRFAKQEKLSVEAAARAVRYRFFARVARRRRCSTIFLAHHADDLVETFLINLFRGAGPGGLHGIRTVGSRQIDGIELTIVRPLLHVWRRQIDEYVKNHRLRFREDATNQDLTPMRNRMRRQIIPYLEKTIGRNIRPNIWKTANILAEEESFFEELLPEKLRKLAVKPLREMSVALQRRMLHRWLRSANVANIGFDLIERVRQLLDSAGRTAKTNLPRNRHVRRRGGKIFIE